MGSNDHDPSFYTCRACGETYHRKSDHRCPGSASDRLDVLETRVEELEAREKTTREVLLKWLKGEIRGSDAVSILERL